MAILAPSDSISALRFPQVADSTFARSVELGTTLGAQLGQQAMESAALLKGRQMELDFQERRDKDLAKLNRRNNIIQALTSGLGSAGLVGGGSGRMAGDVLRDPFRDPLVLSLMDPNDSLVTANNAQGLLSSYRAGMLPSIATSTATAGTILRSAAPS